MGEDLAIDFELTGVDLAIIQVARLARMVASIGQPFAVINRQMAQHVSGVRAAAGPWSRLLQMHQQYAAALQSGDQLRIMDAQYRLAVATKAVQRAQGVINPQNSMGQALKNLIFSTRVGAGAGGLSVAPLVGRLLQFASHGGPAGMAAAAVIMAVTALASAAHKAAEFLNEVASARYVGGGTAAETGQAAAIGAAVGMSPGDMARAARQLADRLATDASAMALAGQHGIRDPLGNNPISGGLNKMRNLLKTIDAIANMTSEADAMRLARATGLESFLGLRDLSSETRRQVMAATAEMFGKDQQQAAAEYRAQTGLLALEMNKLLIGLTPAVKDVADLARELGPLVGLIMKLSLATMPLIWLFRILAAAVRALKAAWDKLTGNDKGTKKDGLKDAVDDNTDALNAATSTMRQIFGGGDRARGALPGNLRGQNMIFRDSINLGAFSL